MGLRAILGGGRVKKKSSNKSRASSSPSWASALPKTKAGASSRSSSKSNSKRSRATDNDDTEVYFHDRLDDVGLVHALVTDLRLRDVAQAQLYIRASMFDPIPERASGLSSAKTAAVLNFRAALPPLASTAHIQTLLGNPTAAEREAAQLIHAGTARRIVVPRRGAVGELLILTQELERLARDSPGLEEPLKDAFTSWLRDHPAAQTLPSDTTFTRRQLDSLVRAGFLTALDDASGRETGLYARPAAPHALLSIETIARAAAGSAAAVGGEGALHASGGSGAARGLVGSVAAGGLRIAVPGSGTFLKLSSEALAHLAELLARAPSREMPEGDLREKWDGGIAGDGEAARAKKARGEFAGVLPGRTRKWKEFHGLAFGWVLAEAVGAGLVEVFETRSVGRGVRLV